MITVSATPGSATARALKTVKDVTNEPLSLIKQRMQAGEVFLSCPYPHDGGSLTEFVRAVEALSAEGLVMEIREVWRGGNSRSITREVLASLTTLDEEIAAADQEYIDRLADSC